MKASLLRNCPSESKKCWGLNTSGVSHSSLSNSTDESIALIGVPWMNREDQACQRSPIFFSLCLSLVEQLHLGNKVSSQHCVFTGHFGESSGDNVSHSLGLMNDGVGVRHVGSVGHSGLTGLSNHPVYFCLDFLCVRIGDISHLKLSFLNKVVTWNLWSVNTDLVSPGCSTGTQGPSAKWWLLFLFQPLSGPGHKHPVSRHWSQLVDPFLAVTLSTTSPLLHNISDGQGNVYTYIYSL